jgi:hypothetical protein
MRKSNTFETNRTRLIMLEAKLGWIECEIHSGCSAFDLTNLRRFGNAIESRIAEFRQLVGRRDRPRKRINVEVLPTITMEISKC